MSLIYLFDARPDAYVAVEWDDIAEEITDLIFENVGTDSYTFTYKWRGQNDKTFDMDAGTPETTIGIPPGQRRWSVRTSGPKAGGYDCELATVGVLRRAT